MKSVLWSAMTLAAIAAGSVCSCFAQASAATPSQSQLAALPDPPAAADTTTASATTASPAPESPVEQEIEVLKAMIDELEREVKEESVATAESSRDASALSAAEKALVGGAAKPVLSASASPAAAEPPAGQAASAPAVAAPTPPAPDIPAEVTTKSAPFAYADWTWLNGNSRNEDEPLATKYFTPEFRADVNYTYDFNRPSDDSLGGSTETFRANEVQVEQLSFGGDLRVDNVRGRFLTMYGMFATTTPRNDASVSRGQWDLADAYRYVSEAWGGYH